MGAGAFRHFVRIEKPSVVSDGGGGQTGTWVLHTQEPARIERLRSFRGDVERLAGGGVGSKPIVRVYLHKNENTDALLTDGIAWRLVDVDTGIPMNINAAQDLDGRGREIVVTATEGAPV